MIRLLPRLLALGLVLSVAAPAMAQTVLLNVSYDPTRELYRDFNDAFLKHWTGEGHAPVEIRQSHGGSGAQARTVIDGLDADVVTLALEADIDAIAAATQKIPADWRGRLPHNSAPYTSTIVFLVRKGNPKGIADWGDLLKDGVQVITPNPKTSGGARWNYLAAWAYANKAFGNDPEKTKQFVGDLYRHVPVLDTGARGSTTTFVQRGIGDVLLAWENEAFLAIEELGPDQFDIVVPSISILAEPPVTLVDGNVDAKGTREVATAYLEYLYSAEGQTIAARHFYRPAEPEKVTEKGELERFPDVELVSIDDAQFGGWAKAQPEHFGDGGIFDQIYRPAN
ncbi:sulfate ABC transporter substrate-binding protein [Aureimonas altamirensis]|uniref:sulfate ABC transporter substrate-binding protein n=1 Tax=Aureimonas altamirensis TaxID=370622 RepID=UPI0020368847|nr:sulfate ABC transporter substrate-binding protein [Aureimonas altamirensis]MCM2503422.1 sulfate ABC transporter substrate-binding protein [Aureimonas altamirensis]